MRIRTHGMPWSKTKKVVIRPQKNEQLDYARAEWLRKSTSAYLAPFAYEMERVRLEYDVTGLDTLKHRLSAPLSSEDFVYLLIGMVQAVMACAHEGYTSSDLIYDPAKVYVDDEGTPIFLFVPLKGVILGVENSPLTYLEALGEPARLRFRMADDTLRSERLADFVRREGVWSLNNFKAFMKQEFGVAFDMDGRPVAVDDHESGFAIASEPGDPSSNHLGDTSGTSFGGFGGYALGGDDLKRGEKALASKRKPHAMLVRERTGESFPLYGGCEAHIGKGTGSTIQILGNGMISRTHAYLLCSGEGIAIRDDGSTNGTFVRGRRLEAGEHMQLAPGEQFKLADEVFWVERTGGRERS